MYEFSFLTTTWWGEPKWNKHHSDEPHLTKRPNKLHGEIAFIPLVYFKENGASKVYSVPMIFDTGSSLSLLPSPADKLPDDSRLPKHWMSERDTYLQSVSTSTGSFETPIRDFRFAFEEAGPFFEIRMGFRPPLPESPKKFMRQAGKSERSKPSVYGLFSLSDLAKVFDIHVKRNDFGKYVVTLSQRLLDL
jgi:hypothetical protein